MQDMATVLVTYDKIHAKEQKIQKVINSLSEEKFRVITMASDVRSKDMKSKIIMRQELIDYLKRDILDAIFKGWESNLPVEEIKGQLPSEQSGIDKGIIAEVFLFDFHELKKENFVKTFFSKLFGKKEMVSSQVNEIRGWQDVVEIFKDINNDKPQRSELLATVKLKYPYQMFFVLLSKDFDNTNFYKNIPFTPISNNILEKAKFYFDRPLMPETYKLLFSGQKIQNAQYTVDNGIINRISNPIIDKNILTVVKCLPKLSITTMDDNTISKYALDSIIHYRNIPIVFYFTALFYFEFAIKTNQFSIDHALITTCRVTEGLLWEVYDELDEGCVVTDEIVINKVRKIFI